MSLLETFNAVFVQILAKVGSLFADCGGDFVPDTIMLTPALIYQSRNTWVVSSAVF